MEYFKSELISLQGVGVSMPGGRPENQDDWTCLDTPLGFLAIVCDGMGGGPGGKTASYIVKHEIANALQSCNPQTPRAEALKMAVSKANDALFRKMDEVPSLRGMGSTMVAILINHQSSIIAHLGDSRCYRISKGSVAFRTRDHSLVGELVRNNALTEEQARLSPQSNVITRGLGNTSNHVAEISEVPYRKGDRFILCSDGVWGIMPHNQLVERLIINQNIESLVNNLSIEVDNIGFSTGGKHDNHTLVAIEMQTDSILKDKMSKKIKIILGALTSLVLVSFVFNIFLVTKVSDSSVNNELEKENQELKRKMALFENVSKDGAHDLITELENLKYEKELLYKSQVALIAKIDSLENTLREMSTSGKVAGGKTTGTTPGSTIISTSSSKPKELGNQILKLFSDLESIKGKNMTKVVQNKINCRLKIAELILTLDKKTKGKYSATFSAINRELQHDKPLIDKVCVNKEKVDEYISTGPAKKKIQELSNKIKNIVDKL